MAPGVDVWGERVRHWGSGEVFFARCLHLRIPHATGRVVRGGVAHYWPFSASLSPPDVL